MSKPAIFDVHIRTEDQLLEMEAVTLGPCAQLSSWATRFHELNPEGKHEELRTAFQRDRDRIVHSRAFRRLKHKTQVFIPYKNDHQRTRLTHTIEVMQLSRTIARCLCLNEDLTEAIALGHDVGHTPFGHVGERTLIQIMQGRELVDVIPEALIKDSGDFKHNVQSVRVVDILESRYDHPGLNLTDQTREGILKHTGWGKWKEYPDLIQEGLNLDRKHPHFEGQVVAIADEIAQQTHDLEDGFRTKLVKTAEAQKLEIVKFVESKNELLQDKSLSNFQRQNTIIRSIIHLLIVNVIRQSAANLEAWCDKHGISDHLDFFKNQDKIELCVTFNKEIQPMFQELAQFVSEKVIKSRTVRLNDESGRYFVLELFRLYYEDPTMLAWYVLEPYRREKGIQHLHDFARLRSSDEVTAEIETNYKNDPDFVRLICDYIAGMSNTFAIREYERWVMPFHG